MRRTLLLASLGTAAAAASVHRTRQLLNKTEPTFNAHHQEPALNATAWWGERPRRRRLEEGPIPDRTRLPAAIIADAEAALAKLRESAKALYGISDDTFHAGQVQGPSQGSRSGKGSGLGRVRVRVRPRFERKIC